MANKIKSTRSGSNHYRIKRKVGTKLNDDGNWVSVYKDFYGKSEDEAFKKFEAYIEEHKRSMAPRADMPMGQVIDEWIETFFRNSDLADSTKKLYEDNYRYFFRPSYVAALPLKDVTAFLVQMFYNECPCKFSNIKPIHGLLKHFYRYCALCGICDDITGPLTLPKKDTAFKEPRMRNIEVWRDDDLKKLVKSLAGTKLRFLVVLAVNTGARIGELLALTYDDIDDDNNLRINKQVTEIAYDGQKGTRLSPTKTACSNRVLTLSDEVMKELEKHKELHTAEMMRRGYTTNILFSSDVGTYPSKSTIRSQLNTIYKQIGVPPHTFHSFRHTFGTNLSRAGVPIERTAKLMGHSDIDVTEQYYLAMGREEKLDAANRIVKYSLE